MEMRNNCSILYSTFSCCSSSNRQDYYIEYLIHVGNVLSGGMINEDDGDEGLVEKGELLESIIATLEMTEAELTANTRRSILSTARQLIGVEYLEEHTIYAQLKKEYIKAVTG